MEFLMEIMKLSFGLLMVVCIWALIMIIVKSTLDALGKSNETGDKEK